MLLWGGGFIEPVKKIIMLPLATCAAALVKWQNEHKTFNLNDAHCSPFQIALLLELVKLQKSNFGFKEVSKNVRYP